MLCGLDLFSGIGGISLALSPWVRPIAYCENDRYAQAVLLSRMRTSEIALAPVWDDVTTLLPCMLPRDGVDIIYGGFPCQDISVAGSGKGLEGKRSGLLSEIVRLSAELRPTFIFLENVPAITSRGLETVAGEMVRLGYDCRWTILSAKEVGAPHLRKRWFMLAMADSECRRRRKERFGDMGREMGEGRNPTNLSSEVTNTGLGETMANSSRWWATEPNVGRMANGISQRVERLKCLGNAVVPLQARKAFKELMGIE